MNPVIVALDVPTAEAAITLADSVSAHVGGFKLGLELLTGVGPTLIEELAALGKPVFVDAKLHDIPNTVEAAAFQLGRRGARWVTAHATGGSEMINAAAEGLTRGSAQHAGILAVTVLTSLDESGLAAVGIKEDLRAHVTSLTRIAAESGAEGVVCSVHEVATVKAVAPDLLAATPGIRPAGLSADDQARIATPEAAVEAGADLLVIGRAITAAHDPKAAAAAIEAAIASMP